MKRIIINKNKCVGCLRCKHICYSVFESGADGKAKVRYGISQGDIENAERAVINWPTGDTSIVNTGSTGKSRKKSLATLLDKEIFIGIIFILIIFYGRWAVQLGVDSFKDESYVPSTEYSEYVIKIAESHVNSDIFEFESVPINEPSNEYVTMRYTFKNEMSKNNTRNMPIMNYHMFIIQLKIPKLRKMSFLLQKGRI